MKTLTADEAFEAYEQVRHRLPEATSPGRHYRHVETLADIASDFDVFLLDAFGVLNIGETAISGTRERIDDLRATGKRVLVVSNAASVSPAGLAEKYRRLGYSFEPDEIVTSRATLAGSLGDLKAIAWGVMGRARISLDDLGLRKTIPLGEDSTAYDKAEGFLLIESGSWTDDRQGLLETSLRRNPRPVLVANPDIVAPREHGFSIEPGHYAHRLADRVGIAPVFFGKPFRNIYDVAFERLGNANKTRVLMVGDSLHTDILGAQSAGLSSALVARHGFFAGQDFERAIRVAGIVPDYVVERP